MTVAPTNLRLSTQVHGNETLVTLKGDRTTQDYLGIPAVTETFFDRSELRTISFDSSRLGRWDCSLLIYLSAVRNAAAPRSIRVDDSGIPIAAKRLLALLPQQAVALAAPARPQILVERFGLRVIAQWAEVAAVIELVGGQPQP